MGEAMRRFALELLRGRFAVARLGAGDDVPEWAWSGALCSVTRTSDELSIVCAEAAVPADVRAERGFRALRVAGALAFSEVGVLAALARPLADAGIPILALSTHDTDYLLVAESQLDAARTALSRAGHRVMAR